jgi:hypothetical protein
MVRLDGVALLVVGSSILAGYFLCGVDALACEVPRRSCVPDHWPFSAFTAGAELGDSQLLPSMLAKSVSLVRSKAPEGQYRGLR